MLLYLISIIIIFYNLPKEANLDQRETVILEEILIQGDVLSKPKHEKSLFLVQGSKSIKDKGFYINYPELGYLPDCAQNKINKDNNYFIYHPAFSLLSKYTYFLRFEEISNDREAYFCYGYIGPELYIEYIHIKRENKKWVVHERKCKYIHM